MNATTTAYLNAMVPLRTAEKSRDQLDNSHSDCPKAIPPRPPLEIFKKGLTALKDSVQKRKDGLVARLNRKEKILAVDWVWMNYEAWLDNDASHVEEDTIVGRFETASDCERGFAHLDTKEMGLEKLKKFAGEVVKISAGMTSKKRKRVVSQLMDRKHAWNVQKILFQLQLPTTSCLVV
ncbi:hypothetical protein B0H13DRAFT_2281505 [Mycena leptocephala]|nr:hypothetical protein B0H13DRAFT_2281505 [Mycena leptocephala]